MIYLDYAANSPVNDEVLDLFYNITKKYIANPNSVHKLGLESKQLLDDYTSKIASLLKIKDEEIIYTSGSSESNNLAIKGIAEKYKNKGKHIITTALEHTSILAPIGALQEAGFEIDILNINEDGLVDLEQLKDLLRDDTILVSIVAVDSEIGIKQPLEEIGLVLKDYPNCLFHTDATQAIGKIKIDLENIDLVTISPHKFGGLNGFGVLIKKNNVQLKPLILGGKSTTVYRSGTPVLGMVASCYKALEIALNNQDENYKYIQNLNNYLKDNLKKYLKVHINSTENSVPHTLNISVKGIKAMDLENALEQYDVYVSTKAACCPTGTISKSVYALSKDKQLSGSTLRISFSNKTTIEELDKFLEYFDKCYKELVED